MARSCKMTKMHFQLIADTITYLDLSPEERARVARHFAVMCQRTNDSFNRERFLEACKTEAERLVEEDARLEGQ